LLSFGLVLMFSVTYVGPAVRRSSRYFVLYSPNMACSQNLISPRLASLHRSIKAVGFCPTIAGPDEF
jgi:hypothetical protein